MCDGSILIHTFRGGLPALSNPFTKKNHVRV
jgi:hypothetical protein